MGAWLQSTVQCIADGLWIDCGMLWVDCAMLYVACALIE